jgi:hypothetical protein
MITTNPQLQESFPQLADIHVENSVYLKGLIKHRIVLLKPP